MNTEFPTVLQRYVAESFASSWLSFGITTEPVTVTQHKFSDKALAAVIGVMGDGIHGTLIVAAELSLLQLRHPMGQAALAEPKLAWDLLGEVTNLTIGAINARFGEDGHMVKISPPSVEAGAVMVLRQYAQKKPTQRFWLGIGDDRVCCQLSADVEPGLELGKGLAPGQIAP